MALEELRWGAFGDVIRQGETGRVNQLLDILRHKALTQMAQESGGSATVRLNTLDWLGGQGREQADNEWHDAINWLGDWCSEEQHPVIWSTTQAAEHLPVRMPRLCSAERPLKVWSMKYFRRGCMSTEMKTGWCCPVAGRWALIRREWLRHWQSVVHRSAWFQGPALAHSMVPLSRPLPICQKLPYARGALGSSGE